MNVPLWGWLAFLAFVAACFVVDLVLGHRGDRPVTFREAARWSAVWVAVGLLFTGVVAAGGGGGAAGEYLAGFLIEKSLSIDNIFVFAMLFGYFAVPAAAQHRALLFGVLGALLLRGVFIAAGASLLATFHWAVWVLGALLVGTGVRMALHSGGEVHPDRNPVLRVLRRVVPMSPEYDGDRLWSGRSATPLLGVLVVVATTDLLFAIDSVPAVFAVTRDTFLVFAANAFSVLGLRPMYFLLAGAMERFARLKYGLAAVLVFVGAKMLLADVVHLSPWVSLLVIAALLGVSVLASLHSDLPPARPERTGEVMTAPAPTPLPTPVPPPARRGLPIRLHASVLVAVAFVTFLLASAVLPEQVPGRSGATYTIVALLGAVLFLLSLLAHEVGHAVVARRNGVPVKAITLWALGGISTLDGEPETPGAAFRIAGIGPLISALAGAALVGGALLTSGLLAAALGWAGVTNLAIAGFNLLPGAPLDGGRLVAAAVWKRTGERARGTAAAARAGRVVGYVVAAAGAGLVVTGSVSSGIWLLIVGWFLASAARLEGARVSVTSALHGVPVSRVMTPATAEAGWLTVGAFLERIAAPSRATVFPLAAFDGSPAGVVTLAQLAAVPAADRSGMRTLAAGTPIGLVGIAEPGEPAESLAPRFGRAGVVLVVTDGSVVGLVTAADLARAIHLAAPSGDSADSTSPYSDTSEKGLISR